jgi:hypothetical protein
MRINKYISIAALIVISSCNEFLDDNINPDLTDSNPPTVILPSAQAQLGFNMGSDLHRYSALWSQQLAAQNGRQTENYDKYILLPTEINAAWRNNFYGGVLADLEEILKNDPAAVHPYYFGIAKALKAFSYSVLVDYWGDIPFSEALQGAANLQPAVDDDATIYPKLIILLDEAIAHLKTTSPLAAPGSDDLNYAGNASRWIRMANTLKLRLYLHMANVPTFNTGEITTFINNTAPEDWMQSNADDYQLAFEAISGKQNPTHQFILSRTDDIATSATLINLMNAKVDPRRATFFTPYPFSPANLASPPIGTNSGYAGLANGVGGGPSNSLSRIHTFGRGAVTTSASSIPAGPNLSVSGLAYDGTAAVNMLTYAEYNFIRAELSLRYGAPGTPQTFYQAGITASILDAGRSAGDAATYVGNNGTLSGTTDEQLQKIIEEKYVAGFLVAGEPWSDWRRTGYPLLNLLSPTLNPGNNGKVPRALVYPQQEVDANPKLAAIQRTSLSDQKVFWDTRTTGQD